MPNKKTYEHQFEVGVPQFNIVKDPYVPLPGAPGIAIPRRFTASLRDLENRCIAHLEVEVHEGRPRLRTIVLQAEAEPLTPTEVRRLPLGAYLDVAVAAVARKVEGVEGGVKITPALSVEGALGTMPSVRAARRRRQPVTRKTLERVAELYRAAPKRQKTQYVADELGCAEGWARQLVMKARQADPPLLPPSGRRKSDG